MLILKTIIGVLFQIGLIASMLLWPAGDWFWKEGLIYLALHTTIVMFGSLYLCIFHPKSIEARLTAKDPNQPVKDKIAFAVLITVSVFTFTLSPLDVFHFHIFPKPSFGLQLLGAGTCATSYIFLFVTMVQNEFAQPIVNVQKDRGHVLVDSGLYASVRHPMYSFYLTAMSGMALWLGSIFAATVGTLLLLLALLPRILVEEDTLKNDLDGYAAYMERVPYRLIPKVF